MCGPIIENEHLWVYTKFMCLHIPISLLLPKNYQRLPREFSEVDHRLLDLIAIYQKVIQKLTLLQLKCITWLVLYE